MVPPWIIQEPLESKLDENQSYIIILLSDTLRQKHYNLLVYVICTNLSDATSSALYLRTLLRAVEWAATNAYDVRALLKIMLSTTTIGELYSVFFKR